MPAPTPIRGRCLCGAVRFQLEPPTDFLDICHCQSCRLSHGAPFVAWTSVPLERFRFDAGEDHVWSSSLRCACPCREGRRRTAEPGQGVPLGADP